MENLDSLQLEDPSLVVVDIDSETKEAIEDALREENQSIQDTAQAEGASTTQVGGAPMEPIPDAMQMSQYAQVIFHDINESYSNAQDLICKYTLSKGFNASHGDRIGMYRLPFLQPHEYLAYTWAPQGTKEVGEVTFSQSELPRETDFYQFQYVKSDGNVAGASIPWQLTVVRQEQEDDNHRDLASSSRSTPSDDDDLVVVQTPFSSLREKEEALTAQVKSLETKYTDMLRFNERLSDELKNKSASYIVLDEKYRSLEVMRNTDDEERTCDLKQLVEDKLKLEQDLNKLREEKFEASERVKTYRDECDKIRSQIPHLEKTIQEHTMRIAQLEEIIRKSDDVRGQLEARIQEMERAEVERNQLKTMLDKELNQSESYIAENQRLVQQLEQTNAMLEATASSKEVAVQEIRKMVEVTDSLRDELHKARKEMEVMEHFLKVIEETRKQETQKSSSYPDSDVQEVFSSLGSKLELAQQANKEKDEIIEKMKDTEKNNKRSSEDMIEVITGQAVQLEEARSKIFTLKTQLDKSEENMKSMKAEYEASIADLNAQIKKGSDENESLRHRLRKEQESVMKLVNEKTAGEKEMQRQIDDLKTETFYSDEEGANEPSLSTWERTSQLSILEPVGVASAAPGRLPSPLVPDNVDPSTPVPELRRREPARYSMTNDDLAVEDSTQEFSDAFDTTGGDMEAPSRFTDNVTDRQPPSGTEHGTGMVWHDHLLECPYCGKTEDRQAEGSFRRMAAHVDEHDNLMCPMCQRPCESTAALQRHVETHFENEDEQSLQLVDISETLGLG